MRPLWSTVNTASGAARNSVRNRHSACRSVSTSSAFSSETESRSPIASMRSRSAVVNTRAFVVPTVTAPIRSPRRAIGTMATPVMNPFTRSYSFGIELARNARGCRRPSTRCRFGCTRPIADPVIGIVRARQAAADARADDDANLSVVADQPHDSAVRLRDVGDGFEKSLENALRIELERDLLAEPPHALEHALRILELARAAHDRLLERGRQLGAPRPSIARGRSRRAARAPARSSPTSVSTPASSAMPSSSATIRLWLVSPQLEQQDGTNEHAGELRGDNPARDLRRVRQPPHRAAVGARNGAARGCPTGYVRNSCSSEWKW